MNSKKRVHVTMPDMVLEALEALAKLRGQSLSDLIEDLGRKELEARGVGPQISAEDIAAAVQRNRLAKLERGSKRVKDATTSKEKKQAAHKRAA